MITGRVHSFESFGTVDGPGIRFVVFLQGCPLRCLYCHNRDTWDAKGGTEYSAEEIVSKALQYKSFMESSGGGITLSGGEPTLQAAFCKEIFRLCKQNNIHTALDTSGHADIQAVEELLNYTDLILLDVKHAVEEKHIALTGASNKKIKKFAYYACEKDIPVWVRYVLVPGYTDDIKDLILAREFISSLGCVEKVTVLPYHTMGAYKWKDLGCTYPLEGVNPPSEEMIRKAQNILSV